MVKKIVYKLFQFAEIAVKTALRTSPQLLNNVLQNTGEFRSIKDASEVFYQNQIQLLQSRIMQIND